MSSGLRITVDRNLPVRARAVGGDALSRIFGGCSQAGGGCTTDADCCPANRDSNVLKCRLNYGTSDPYDRTCQRTF